MYEISYQNNKRVTISMGQFHDSNLHFKLNDDNTFVHEHIEKLYALSCYGNITHYFHSQLNTPIKSICVRTSFNCQMNFTTGATTDTEWLFNQFKSFNFDSAWAMYTTDQIRTLIHNIQYILQTQYNINHSVQFCINPKWFITQNRNEQLNCQLMISSCNILPHELFFILNIYRRLFTLSNKKTNDIVFQLTQNATTTWCNLDAVSLLVLFDYFNTYSPNDSLIGYVFHHLFCS